MVFASLFTNLTLQMHSRYQNSTIDLFCSKINLTLEVTRSRMLVFRSIIYLIIYNIYIIFGNVMCIVLIEYSTYQENQTGTVESTPPLRSEKRVNKGDYNVHMIYLDL